MGKEAAWGGHGRGGGLPGPRQGRCGRGIISTLVSPANARGQRGEETREPGAQGPGWPGQRWEKAILLAGPGAECQELAFQSEPARVTPALLRSGDTSDGAV